MTKLTTEELREPWCLKCGRKASDHNVRHPFQPSHELPSIHDLAAENAALRTEVEKLRPWARLGVAVMEGWPDTAGDMDGFELQDRAVTAGVLQEVPGGYDPEQHIDSAGVCPETGDPWFEMVRCPSAAALSKGNGQ